jgi:hypothetical protein
MRRVENLLESLIRSRLKQYSNTDPIHLQMRVDNVTDIFHEPPHIDLECLSSSDLVQIGPLSSMA